MVIKVTLKMLKEDLTAKITIKKLQAYQSVDTSSIKNKGTNITRVLQQTLLQ